LISACGVDVQPGPDRGEADGVVGCDAKRPLLAN